MMWCHVYRGTKKENCYLYTEMEGDFSSIPTTILSIFGTPVYVMKVLLDGKRRLAVGTSAELEEKIRKDGFFLQMLHEYDFKL